MKFWFTFSDFSNALPPDSCGFDETTGEDKFCCTFADPSSVGVDQTQPPIFPIDGSNPRPCIDHTSHCTRWFSVTRVDYRDSLVSAVSISAVFDLVRFTNSSLNSTKFRFSAVFYQKISKKKCFFKILSNFEARKQYLTHLIVKNFIKSD